MDGKLAAAIDRLRAAFAGYPVRAVLAGCPHCCPPERVAGFDLFDLSTRLGGTVGTSDDLKSHLPLLLESLVTTDELDATIVLGRLAGWQSWPLDEHDAIGTFLDAAWRAILSTYPTDVGALSDAATFLRAVAETVGDPGWLLALWDDIEGPAADRHLADLISHSIWRDGLAESVLAWLRRRSTADRMYSAFVNDTDGIAADDYAQAYDIVSAILEP